jgi:hypothetical protein
VIERSGRVHQVDPEPLEMGTARPDIIVALTAAVDGADYDAIRSVPFTGECPVHVDGQEIIYEFATDTGVERIASCETEVDPGHPLFAAVEAALASLPRSY